MKRDMERDTPKASENKGYMEACHAVTQYVRELPLYAHAHAQRRLTPERGSVTHMRDNGGAA
jgi:hypothetical protein